MDTRNTFVARRRARGAIRFEIVAIVGIVAVLAIAAYFLVVRPVLQQRQQDMASMHMLAAGKAQGATTAAPVDLQALDVNQLLDEANKALKQQRYLAPAGNNAFEFYLRVLAKQPGNAVATAALRETFPQAASLAEQTINARNFNEAQREIDLLAKADPTNFTLTILRSKLDAQQKLVDQQQRQAQDQQKAAALAAQKAAVEKTEVVRLAEQQKAQQTQAAEEARLRQQQLAEQRQATQQPAQVAAPAAVAQSTGAVLIKRAEAHYPTAAMRANLSGWVLVGFTVTAEGRTTDVHVVDALPRHVFDRAAMEAVSRYRFTPATRNGVAVESKSQQKIEFSTGH